jgi:hypothetical protein
LEKKLFDQTEVDFYFRFGDSQFREEAATATATACVTKSMGENVLKVFPSHCFETKLASVLIL